MNYNYNELNLKSLKTYMKRKRWKFLDFSEYLEKAVYIPNEDIFIMTPKSEESSDYKIRVEQIIEKLSIIHEIPKEKVFKQIIVKNKSQSCIICGGWVGKYHIPIIGFVHREDLEKMPELRTAFYFCEECADDLLAPILAKGIKKKNLKKS